MCALQVRVASMKLLRGREEGECGERSSVGAIKTSMDCEGGREHEHRLTKP